jgi:hypothetical protein
MLTYNLSTNQLDYFTNTGAKLVKTDERPFMCFV